MDKTYISRVNKLIKSNELWQLKEALMLIQIAAAYDDYWVYSDDKDIPKHPESETLESMVFDLRVSILCARESLAEETNLSKLEIIHLKSQILSEAMKIVRRHKM